MIQESEAGVHDPANASSELSQDASRRGFLGLGLKAAVLAGFAARLQAQTQSGTLAPPHSTSRRAPTGDLRFLVNRVTNGWNTEAWNRAQLLGYDGFLEEQLDHASIDDSAMDATLAAYPTLPMTSKQIYDTYVVPNQTQVPVNELKIATVLRGAQSKRQLFERMVEF
jgi:hypothetical protein